MTEHESLALMQRILGELDYRYRVIPQLVIQVLERDWKGWIKKTWSANDYDLWICDGYTLGRMAIVRSEKDWELISHIFSAEGSILGEEWIWTG